MTARGALEPIAVIPGARKTRAGLGDLRLGPAAGAAFADLGIEVAALAAGRRRRATACSDWTESRPHLAGALGTALLAALIRNGWLARRSATRALRITPSGRAALPRRFGGAVTQLLA